MNPFLTIFIPAYNEEHNLPKSVNVIRQKVAEIGIEAEILIVDDGSTDNTGAIADELASKYAYVRVIHHTKNGGIGMGFLTACQYALGAWLILIPADLALEPDQIRRYIDASPGADVVIGLRSNRSDYTWVRKIISFINITLIQFLFGMKEHQFQYISMYRMSVLRDMDIDYPHSAFFLAEILIKAKALGGKLTEVEINYIPRTSGVATGAKFRQIIATVRDIFHFWLRWIRLGQVKASQPDRLKSRKEKA